MKHDGKYMCMCEVCQKAKEYKFTEYDLHLLIGIKRANHKCDLRSFEKSLNFSSVTHWDVGFTDDARFYIYRDGDGKMIAWFDSIKGIGFKEEG